MPANAPSLTSGSVREVELLALAQRTADGTGSAVTLTAEFRFITFQLAVTARSAGGGDSLNVYIQQQLDGGNWDDLVSFTQIATAGPVVDHQSASMPRGRDDAAAELHTCTDGTLAASTVRAMVVGRKLRVKWVIPSGTYSFAVSAFPS